MKLLSYKEILCNFSSVLFHHPIEISFIFVLERWQLNVYASCCSKQIRFIICALTWVEPSLWMTLCIMMKKTLFFFLHRRRWLYSYNFFHLLHITIGIEKSTLLDCKTTSKMINIIACPVLQVKKRTEHVASFILTFVRHLESGTHSVAA